jgi:purine nucleoside phosphorylase
LLQYEGAGETTDCNPTTVDTEDGEVQPPWSAIVQSGMTAQIGIIGGSGLYEMAELTDREERTVSTPFGDPSGPFVIGTLSG